MLNLRNSCVALSNLYKGSRAIFMAKNTPLSRKYAQLSIRQLVISEISIGWKTDIYCPGESPDFPEFHPDLFKWGSIASSKMIHQSYTASADHPSSKAQFTPINKFYRSPTTAQNRKFFGNFFEILWKIVQYKHSLITYTTDKCF